MPCDQQAQVATEDWKRRARVETERARIIEQQKRELDESLAEVSVQVEEINKELGVVARDRDECERQRKIAHDALDMAIKIIAAGHAKDAPTHKGGEAQRSANCKTCIQLRSLSRQLVRSARPESRMALAS